MPTALCPQLLRLRLFVTVMAVLASPLYAQTLPVPKVSLTLRPDLVTNVWPADFNGDGRTDLIAGTGPFVSPSTQLTVAIGPRGWHLRATQGTRRRRHSARCRRHERGWIH